MSIFRDLRGHFARKADKGKPCPHACCHGSRVHPPEIPVIVSKRAARKRAPAGQTRAEAREDARIAIHAQVLREEAYAGSGTGKAESRSFYGGSDAAAYEHAEKRLRMSDYDDAHRDQGIRDRDDAQQHRAEVARRAAAGEVWDHGEKIGEIINGGPGAWYGDHQGAVTGPHRTRKAATAAVEQLHRADPARGDFYTAWA